MKLFFLPCMKTNMSRRTKKELLQIAEQEDIGMEKRMKKCDIIQRIQVHRIQEMKLVGKDTKDPISLEPFDDWEFDDLLDGVFCHGYWYKPSTMRQYVFHCKKDCYIDPVSRYESIPQEIVERFSNTIQRDVRIDNIMFEVQTRTCRTDYFEFQFYCILLHAPSFRVSTTLLKERASVYIVGVLPKGIVLESTIGFPYEMNALDTASTSDALLIRVIELYKSGAMYQQKGNHLTVNRIQSLPCRCHQWFEKRKGFMYIDIKQHQNTPTTIYHTFLRELALLE